MYALTLDENNRILSATTEAYATSSMTLVSSLPSGNLYDWLYVGGEYTSTHFLMLPLLLRRHIQ